jgi:serine/threonine-protein kinase HipA
MPLEKIKVSLDFGASIQEVGTLVAQNQLIYFRYAPSFLESNLEISPFKFKKTAEIIACPKEPFEGIPGVFNDSIPDGWGRLLLDRKLINQGINSREIGVLDRLSLIGNNGMGALVYEPISEKGAHVYTTLNLDDISRESQELLTNGNASFLDDLYHLGGNSVGARPKIVVHYNEDNQIFNTDNEENSTSWIIKFSGLNDFMDISKIEFSYYRMALACGIKMNESNLFISEKGRSFFGSKRFDILDNKRLHLHSACGLLHDNFRYSTLDYGHIMDAANRLENDLTACEKVFRLAVFNCFSLNMDDHSKNTAFLMAENGKWHLAPAFDLTFSPSPGGYQSLSVAGEYQHINSASLLKLADYFGIKDAKNIIEEVKEVISQWTSHAASLDINKKEFKLIEKALQKKLKEG